MIPKIIHYCWLSNDDIPENLQVCMKTWKEKLPDYEFILWNFDRFNKESSRWVSEAFDNKKYAFAADYIRLFAVYNYGGIYMDMDVEVVKDFSPLLDTDLMCAYEDDERYKIEAGCFGASKNNPIIKECLSYYDNRSFIKSDGHFDTVVLPEIIGQYISKYKDLRIYEKDYFTAKSHETGITTVTENTYSIHHFAASWTSKKQKRFESFKRKVYAKFGKKVGYIICIIPLIDLKLSEKGLKETYKDLKNKIGGKK